MENTKTEYFDDYLDSIFMLGNKLSPAEFESAALAYEMQYGPYMPASMDARILDAGCGAGHFLYFLKKRGYKNFLGVDISRQQTEYCRKNISGEVLLCDIFEFLGGRREEFELVTLNDIIEHIPKSRVVELVKLARQSLRPGGRVFLKTPNMGNCFSTALRYVDFTHENGFTETSLRQVLWLGGFRDIFVFGPEPAEFSSLKGRVKKALRRSLNFVVRLMYRHQGYGVPEILTPLLSAIAKK